MGMQKSDELPTVFDCTIRQESLEEFDPEAERAELPPHAASRRAGGVRQWEPSVAPSTGQAVRWWLPAILLVIATALASAIVVWLGIPSSRRSTLPTPRPPALSETPPAEVADAPVLAGAPKPTIEAPQVRTPQRPPAAPVTKPEPASAAAVAPASAPAPVAPAAPIVPALGRTLATVSQSYRALDAASLSQTFSQLKYQTLKFDRCTARPNGPIGAIASCDVSIATASKDGDQALQRRQESWTLVLDRSSDPWRIVGLSRR
jgi:hypothetical protein